MNIEELRVFCLSVRGAYECMPFDNDTLVMKIMGKMFALIPLDRDELSVSLKCDPSLAEEARERSGSIVPAYHLNKKYWNTIFLNREVKDEDVKKYILHSVNEVLKKLSKKDRDEYFKI